MPEAGQLQIPGMRFPMREGATQRNEERAGWGPSPLISCRGFQEQQDGSRRWQIGTVMLGSVGSSKDLGKAVSTKPCGTYGHLGIWSSRSG